MKKYIRSDKNGEYKSHCVEICLESEISNHYHIHIKSNEKSNVERNDGCIIYKFGFTQNLCGGTILTSKGTTKSFVFLEKKAFGLIRIQSFPYEKWKGRKSNLKYFKVWGI